MLKSPSKSTLSYQNKHRSWKVFRDYYYVLLESLGHQAHMKRTNFKTKKGAYDTPLLKGSIIVADRFYNDFSLPTSSLQLALTLDSYIQKIDV